MTQCTETAQGFSALKCPCNLISEPFNHFTTWASKKIQTATYGKKNTSFMDIYGTF